MFTKLDEGELKLEESRKKDQSYTVKTHKNVPTSYELGVSKDVLNKENEHIYHRGEIVKGEYLLKKVCAILQIFPNKKKSFTEDQTKYWSEKTCLICKGEFIGRDKNYWKIRHHCRYRGKYQQSAYSISILV